MKVNGKFDVPATLLLEKKPPVANEQQAGWAQDLVWIQNMIPQTSNS
jgi:hypothetical protein